MRDEYLIMLGAWGVVAFWIALVIFLNRKVHPKALFYLFMVELWERFSYYGMRAFLVLYLTAEIVKNGFGLEKKVALGIYAAYGALVYLTPLAGGMLADKILGFRKAIIWGAILMAAGQFTLSMSIGREVILFLGLAMLTIGNGFFKPNITSTIGRFYGQGDPRRDGAFTIFYMGINMGAFLAPLTCGAIGEIEGWQYGFLTAGCGMVLGLCIFLYTSYAGYLENHANPPAGAETKKVFGLPASWAVYAGTLLVVPVAALMVYKNEVMDVLLGIVGIGAIGGMIFLSFQYPVAERQRIWVIVVLLFFTTVFWAFFELAGSALTLFTEANVEKSLVGMKLTTSMFQGANALFIMLFAPVFSVLWVFLAKRNIEPNAPVKFAFGLLLLGAGFLALNLGRGAVVAGVMPAIFLIFLYLLHTWGELALSPVGLSLVTKLAPAKFVGFMMGFWFLSSAIAHQSGKWIASEAVADKNATPEETLALSLEVFNNVGLFAIGSGVLLILLSPILKKWMHNIK